jgi:copper transport protein
VALTRLRTIESLLEEDYGRILLAKMALVAYMLALAVGNRRLTRGLAVDGARTAARLRRNVRLEIVCAGALLAATAWLGHTRPPAEMHAHAAAAGRAVMAVESDGASVLVEISPARRGANRVIGRMTLPDGRPLLVRELAVELSLPEAGIEPLTVRAMADQAGGFTLEAVLPVPGRWEMRVDALVSDFEKRVFTLQLDID